MGASTLRIPPRGLAAAAAAASGLLGLAAALYVIGPVVALALLAAPVIALLLWRPPLAVALLVGLVIVAEARPESVFGPLTARLYEPIALFTPLELLLLVVVAGIARERLVSGHRLGPPMPLVVALGLTALATVAGTVTGLDAGTATGELRSAIRVLLVFVVVPLVVLGVVRTAAHAWTALALVAGAAVFKAAQGLFAVTAGGGLTVEGETITFYEPTANWVMLLFLMVVAAATLGVRRGEARLPLWMLLAWPFVLAALVLSFRRSFWIAIVLGLAVVVLLGFGALGRRLAVPVAVVLAAGFWALTSAGSFSLDGPLGQRVESLKPSRVQASAEDRYRLDERANVWAEVRRSPVVGLGLGVPWRATRPLPVENEGGRQFVHFAALWWWVKLGVLGVVAWAAVMATALWLAASVWRSAGDARVRAVGLGALAATAGLLFVELTTTFTGVDVRFSVVFAAGLGLLAALRRIHGAPAAA